VIGICNEEEGSLVCLTCFSFSFFNYENKKKEKQQITE